MMRQSPLSYSDQVKAPTLVIHGEVDQRVPFSEAEQMYLALKHPAAPACAVHRAPAEVRPSRVVEACS